jgi:hypothetical protein
MAVQGAFGAFDTLYYHEYRARLPAGGVRTRPELRLHAGRDFIYAILFCTLPWVAWQGTWAWVLAVFIASEIAITMADFGIEARTRKPDGVAPGEIVTHALMAMIYGATLARLVPEMIAWTQAPPGLVAHAEPIVPALQFVLTLMGIGVLATGVRDLYASLGRPPLGGLPPAGP